MGNHTLASDVVSQQEEGFPQLFPPQQAGAAPFDTVSQQGQGRDKKLVTEEPKPVGSGRFRDRFQDARAVLETIFPVSLPLARNLLSVPF